MFYVRLPSSRSASEILLFEHYLMFYFQNFFILEKNKTQKQGRYNREIQHETNFVVGEAENAAKNLAWIYCFDFAPHVSTRQHIYRTLVKFCIIPSVNFRNQAQESIHLVQWVQTEPISGQLVEILNFKRETIRRRYIYANLKKYTQSLKIAQA